MKCVAINILQIQLNLKSPANRVDEEWRSATGV
jgi:hypothetical protein